jgi:hypothetical protein
VILELLGPGPCSWWWLLVVKTGEMEFFKSTRLGGVSTGGSDWLSG